MNQLSNQGVTVRPVRAEDHLRWRDLYAGYAAFYRVAQSDEQANRVWDWLHDPSQEVAGLVAVDASDRPIGLAHYRAFPRPLTATIGGFLDDLFVDPAERGTGAADALLAALADIAAERGWSVIRWITAEDNYRARGVYDRHATRTGWVTYDMQPGGA
jgi:GNAT superfamily N-acetyltransferase